ncbi:hypothetical protein OS347_000722 [Vibrio vulnificus]|nr:hypothetical protein [Vibrio vulnificus]
MHTLAKPHFEKFKLAVANAGYKLLSEYYVNCKTKILLECPKGHEYNVAPEHFIEGNRCPKCPRPVSIKSRNVFQKLIDDAGYKLASEYERDISKVKIICDKGHEYETTPNSFKRGDRCPKCPKNRTIKSMNKFIKLLEQSNYKMIGSYTNAKGKVTLSCNKGHTYEARVQNFNQGKRCPSCRESGYSNSKQGMFYLVRWTKDNRSFLKFGVTNNVDVNKRIAQQKQKTKYIPSLIDARYYINGQTATKIENIIHTQLTTGIVDVDSFGSGFTETIEDNEHNIKLVTDLMKEHIYTGA